MLLRTLKWTCPLLFAWKYEYDGLQRLSAGNRGELNSGHTGITNPQFGQCWTLDETGNWQGFRQDDTGSGTWSLIQDRTASPVNQITEINASTGNQWATPVYDANGNMTTIPRPDLPRPSWANLTADQWAELTVAEWSAMEVVPKFFATYDAWNRLVTLTDGGTGKTVQENAYDGRNYRIICQTYVDGSVTETRQYIYTDGWQVIEERLGVSTTPDRQFVWGVRYIDDLIIRDRSISGGTLNERLYALQDANWNVTAVVDDSGVLQERFEYDSYGETTVLSPQFTLRHASSFNWDTRYCGYRSDSFAGLFAVRNRFFGPHLGTWLTRDPVGYAGGSNLFSYVDSKPVTLTDPTGLKVFICYRQFGQDKDYTQEQYANMFRNKRALGNLPRIAHVYLRIDHRNGQTTTYSFHPNTWPTGTVDADTPRPARIWINDPSDIDLKGIRGKGPLQAEFFEITDARGQEAKLTQQIADWIKKNGVGVEIGPHAPDPRALNNLARFGGAQHPAA